MSYNLKITIYNNRDYEQPFILKDSDGNVLDLTGCTLVFGYGTDIKTLATHTSGGASNKCVFVTDAANGAFKLVLPYSVLKTLSPATYSHDLILIDVDAKRTGVWSGNMIVKRGVA